MDGIYVTSDIKPLKKVLLHRPGNELLNLTPDSLKELLFEDIPYLKNAQKEHDKFADILRKEGVEVVYLENLMAEVLDGNPRLRRKFLNQFIKEANIKDEAYIKAIISYLDNNYPDSLSLVLKTMEGVRVKEIPKKKSKAFTGLVNDDREEFILKPMPNLYFTRDPFASIGKGASIHKMYSNTRCRETIYAEYILKYHKDYKGKVKLYTNRNDADHIEGGDILNLNEYTLAVGLSQRTSPDAVERLAANIFKDRNSKINTIYAINIPNSRAFMHLDTVFTQVDYNKFTIHSSIIGILQVFKITSGKNKTIEIEEINDTLENILKKALNVEKVELYTCGAGDSIAAAREQWNDGSNTLCIAPGVIVVYDRNEVTNAYLKSKGLRVIEIPSGELSRGRGGPRCMSMPLIRED